MPFEHIKISSTYGAERSSLAQLVIAMRQRSGEYVLTSVAHGARDHRMLAALQQLQGLGVVASPARVPPVLDGSGLGFICIEARGGRAGPRSPLPVLLVIAQAEAQGLLIPAVQKVRDAASRLQLPAGTRVYLGGGAPTAGSGAWIPFMSTSN